MGNLDRVKQFAISVSGIIIKLIADESLLLWVDEGHRNFGVQNGEPDISIKVHYGELPNLRLDEKLFDTRESGGLWTLYRSRDNYELTLHTTLSSSVPYRVAVFNADFTCGDLYINASSPVNQGDTELPCYNPVEYPFDEILYINFLSHGRGVNLHACGISVENKGVLFSGVSGAGKSTIAELWKKREVDILSDDRIIVRHINGDFLMFGTPWHGDARASLPKKVPLKAIYFLEQSKENKVIPLNIDDSVFRLMVRCFPTYYSRQGLESTLDIITAIVKETPCYELQFTPDEHVLETVLDHVNNLT